MNPSKHLTECQQRIAEIEVEAERQGDHAAIYRAARFRERCLANAKIADTENRLQFLDAARMNDAAHAFHVFHTVELSDADTLALVDVLLEQMTLAEERGQPIAWMRQSGAARLVEQLKTAMDDALERDPYSREAGSEENADAIELRLHDRTEARAINSGSW